MSLVNSWKVSSVLSIVMILATSTNVEQARAQQIARMRFVWDIIPASGALYLNICGDPNFNTSARTGGCAKIDVLNSNVTANKERTYLVSDRLKSGEPYKACLIADNIGGSYNGRWIQCRTFLARDGDSVGFFLSDLRYVGAP